MIIIIYFIEAAKKALLRDISDLSCYNSDARHVDLIIIYIPMRSHAY